MWIIRRHLLVLQSGLLLLLLMLLLQPLLLRRYLGLRQLLGWLDSRDDRGLRYVAARRIPQADAVLLQRIRKEFFEVARATAYAFCDTLTELSAFARLRRLHQHVVSGGCSEPILLLFRIEALACILLSSKRSLQLPHDRW